jgi:hypothetical protein
MSMPLALVVFTMIGIQPVGLPFGAFNVMHAKICLTRSNRASDLGHGLQPGTPPERLAPYSGELIFSGLS